MTPEPAPDPIRAHAMWADRTGRSRCTPPEWLRQTVTEPFYVHHTPPAGLGLRRVLARPPHEDEGGGGVVVRRRR